MIGKKYLDLDILIEATEEGDHIRVVNSPAGIASQDFKLPLNQVELKRFLFRLGAPPASTRPQTGELSLPAVKDFGGQLYRALFGSPLRNVFRKSLEEASRQRAGLRIRLRFLGPGLVDLPWEFLYNPFIDRFLCLSPEMSLIRFQEYPEQIPPAYVKGPLRVLVMVAGPVEEIYEPVNIVGKWKSLSKSTIDIQRQKTIIFDCLDEATLPALRRQLQMVEYHIFHFIGHSDFSEYTQETFLVLENGQKGSELVSGRDIGILLNNHHTLRLVILQACEGERRGIQNPFAGVAQSLVQHSIPAVVTVQFAIREKAVGVMHHELYQQVVAGAPIDQAMIEIRRAIYKESSQMDWAAPAVFTRTPDGVLFEISGRNPSVDIARQRPFANLFVRQGTQVGENFPLQEDSYLIGRDLNLPIALKDNQVSRVHAQIIHSSLGFWLEDLQSTNGTFVNGVRITSKAPLRNGDVIRIGETTLVFDQGAKQRPPTKPMQFISSRDLPKMSEEEKREKIAALWKEAEKALDQQQWEVAATSLQALLNLDPSQSKARTELASLQKGQRATRFRLEAEAARSCGDWNTVIARLQAILNLEPNDSEIRAQLHQAQQEQKIASLLAEAQAARAQENFPLAIARLQAVLILQPDHSQAREEQKALIEQQKLAKTADLYRQAQANYETEHYWQALELFYQVKQMAGNYQDVEQLIATIEGLLTP